ncbi:MAG: RNA polymerase sigma factor [Lewinella sp.]
MYELTEQEEWAQAYQEFGPELESFVRSRIGNGEAEDLLQEVWAVFATAVKESSITDPRAWLYRVARNRITDGYRLAARRPAFQDLSTTEEEVEEQGFLGDPDELWEEIEAALDQVPPDQREVFIRNELDGETLREIAADLGVPLKTIISRKGYARRRLQDLLQEVYEEYFEHY